MIQYTAVDETLKYPADISAPGCVSNLSKNLCLKKRSYFDRTCFKD